MKRICRQKPRLGFTIVGLVVVLVVLSLAAAILIPALHRARHGASYVKCRTQLKQTHSAWVLASQTNEGRFPVPLELDAATANSSIAPGNSTANLHSMMVFQKYYSPNLLICTRERSWDVSECTDYDYGGADSSLDPAMKWDPNFDCEITGKGGRESNVSFANLAPTGDRFKNEWQDTLNSSYAIMGDRGPKNGVWDQGSYAGRIHGSKNQWSGNVVYNDNHVEGMSVDNNDAAPFAPTGITFLNASGQGQPDNLFFEDDTINGADIWMSIFVQDASDPAKYVPLWD